MTATTIVYHWTVVRVKKKNFTVKNFKYTQSKENNIMDIQVPVASINNYQVMSKRVSPLLPDKRVYFEAKNRNSSLKDTHLRVNNHTRSPAQLAASVSSGAFPVHLACFQLGTLSQGKCDLAVTLNASP